MSNVQLDPYLFFSGNAKEALEFYKEIFGGELDISTFGSMPQDQMPEDARMDNDKIMHGLLSGGAVRLMAGDSQKASADAKKIELSLSGEDDSQLRKFWDELAKGGMVRFPLEKAPWGDTFGMLTDKYNIAWMVNIAAKKS
jgi:PhnB protein